MVKTPPKNSTRDSEISLLKQLSTQLDANGAPNLQLVDPVRADPFKKSVSDVLKNASRDLLLVRVIVKGIVKACIEEKISTVKNDKKVGVIDALVEEYRPKYPSLSKEMVIDGIARQKRSQEKESAEPVGEEGKEDDGEDEHVFSQCTENAEDDGDHQLKVARCMEIVGEELDEYYEKVETLKRRRESAASEPVADCAPPPQRPRGRPKGSKAAKGNHNPHTPDFRLVNEITERYVKERQQSDRLEKGAFEAIVEEAKKDLGLEDIDLPLKNIRKRVTRNYINLPDSEKGIFNKDPKKKQELCEEVYTRYSRTKKSNKGRVAPGTLQKIIEGVKIEMGMTDTTLNMATLETKVQSRFSKENPDYAEELFSKLSDNDKRRRQLLMNEVTSRYARAKKGTKKLPDGELDRIIAETKSDLGIHDFEVPKVSLRGRIQRKSLQVMTLGKTSPYDAIDGPLVKTINTWLDQGISVTRAQGLELANTMLKGKKMEKDSNGNDILLDAGWWRNFLERNKNKIVCS